MSLNTWPDLTPRTVTVTVRGGGIYSQRRWRRFLTPDLNPVTVRVCEVVRDGDRYDQTTEATVIAQTVLLVVDLADRRDARVSLVLAAEGDSVTVTGYGRCRLDTTGRLVATASGDRAQVLQIAWQTRPLEADAETLVAYAQHLAAWLASDALAPEPFPWDAPVVSTAPVIVVDLDEVFTQDHLWGAPSLSATDGLGNEFRRRA